MTDMHDRPETVAAAADRLRQAFGKVPVCAVILGSGLADITKYFRQETSLPFTEIPGFPHPSARGHKGLIMLTKEPAQALWMLGRFHLYEGRKISEIVFPVRVFAKAGVKTIILTNAAGALNESLNPGDVCLITDHLNFLSDSPLKGEEIFGERHVDCSAVYDRGLRKLFFDIANSKKIPIKEGVYAATTGPQYETPAEAKMYRLLGADFIGMSTVPEALAAKQLGLKVLALSLITNRAGESSSHDGVLEMASSVSRSLASIISDFLEAVR